MAGPGTFFGAPLMAGTTQYPTTNPSTGAVIPSNAGTAPLVQTASVAFGALTASIAVPPGSLIIGITGVVTTTITGATTWVAQVGTTSGGSQLGATTSSNGLTAGSTSLTFSLTAAAVNAATIANPGVIFVTLTAASISAGAVTVIVEYIPTVENLDSNF